MAVAIIGQTQTHITIDGVERLMEGATVTHAHSGPMQRQYRLVRTITYPDTGEVVDSSCDIVTNVPSDADDMLRAASKRNR